MNEADSPSFNLDELRLVPDWMREDAPSPSKQYAGHDYPAGDEGRTSQRGARQGPGQFNRDRRAPQGDRRSGGGNRDRGRDRPGGNRGPDRRDSFQDRRPAPVEAPPAPAPVQVTFLPDDRCMASNIKQIRSTHMAYPLFSLARMFLQEPARHLVQFTLEPAAAQAGTSLYQLGGEGPVTLERSTLEKLAFDTSREQYYTEQTVQKEPLKGNFTNVARERLSGTLLGPTNYHAYQPALRSLYESRFSRRMSFEDFRRNVEVVSDPALIERWKEEARTTTTIVTKDGEPPTTLPSLSEARAHFRQHYLDTLVRTGTTFRVHGSVARDLPEPAMMQAIRQAHERELRYPAQFVQLLRQGLQNAGLHIFKHRKRVVYVSLARPTPFVAAGSAVSENVATILETVGKFPLCTRKVLAERLLARNTTAGGTGALTDDAPVAIVGDSVVPPTGPTEAPVEGATEPATVEAAPQPAPAPAPPEDASAKAKAALAADLRFLVQAGHIIEFHNGTFDLPLPPKSKEESSTHPGPGATKAAPERPDDIGADPAVEARSQTPQPAASPSPEAEPESVQQPIALGEAEPAPEVSTVEAEASLPAANVSEDPVPADVPAHSEPITETSASGAIEEPTSPHSA